MPHPGWILSLALALLSTFALAEDPARAARFFEDALSRYEKEDYAGAVVQLKNALQQDARMLQAHVLLGQAELKLGNAGAAETSFDNALKMGADRAEITPQLAQAYFGQGKFRELAERINPVGLPGAIQQEILLLRAYAHMELGDRAAADVALSQAGTFGRSADYLVAKGMLALQQGQHAAARSFADQALALEGKHAKAWNLRASIDHLRGATQDALRGYATALEYKPNFADARVARAGILLDLSRLDELEKELALLRAKSPGDPRGAYLESVLLSRRGKEREARAALLEAAKLIDSLPPTLLRNRGQVLMLGALANYGLNALAKAQGYLESYIRLHPDHPGARKMLGSLYLRESRADVAIPVLEKAAALAPNDADVMLMLASAYLSRNQHAKAANLLERAGAAARNNPGVSASLGLGLLGVGRIDSGLHHMTQAFRQRPADGSIASALVMLHIQRGHAREAVGVAEMLLSASGQKAPAYNLLGVARAAARDYKGARAAYGKALALAPGLDAARLNLGKLESSLGNHDIARQHFSQLIKGNPRHVQAQYELARVDVASGRMADAIDRLEKLRSIDASRSTALTLGDYYLADNQAAKALDVAKDLSGSQPDDFDVLSLLGRAQAANGRNDLARVAFGNMGRQAGFDVGKLVETARLQLRLRDLDGASLSLNKALSVSADHLPTNLLLVERERLSGGREKALAMARQLASRFPGRPEPHRLLGDIAASAGRPADAIPHYRTSLNLSGLADDALRLYQGLMRAGDTAAALDMLEGWNRGHPGNATAQLAMADGWMQAGRLDQAKVAYEHYIRQYGERAPALNNLALLFLRRGEMAQALRHAERAYVLAPGSPISNDTLGWILIQMSETDRALRHLRDARLRAPNTPEIHYHLAVALHKAGRTAEAARELELALKQGSTFEGSGEARHLLDQMRR